MSDHANWTTQHHTAPTGMQRDYPVRDVTSLLPLSIFYATNGKLAALGHAQADNLAAFLSDPARTAPYPPPEKVISSPFYRCVQTGMPTALALSKRQGKKCPIGLEHGVQEWYSTALEGSGLHPRPGHVESLAPHFPEGMIDPEYSSTVYASRRGETLRGLHERVGLFLDTWIARMDEMGVRSVVIFGHAATVIAIGRLVSRRNCCGPQDM